MAWQRAPASAPTLLERVIVTDKAVEAGNPVVERPRRSVVLLRRPVEPIAAALAGDRGHGFDQPAANALASKGCVDKEILQVTNLLGRPGMRVKEVVDNPGKRRSCTAEAGSQTADRAVRGRSAAARYGRKSPAAVESRKNRDSRATARPNGPGLPG